MRAPDPALSPWARHGTSEVGADLKVAVTPNLTLDLTANTDFAETEVDGLDKPALQDLVKHSRRLHDELIAICMGEE